MMLLLQTIKDYPYTTITLGGLLLTSVATAILFEFANGLMVLGIGLVVIGAIGGAIKIGNIMAKARKKTPMKNKTCFWRRMAKKSYEGKTEIRTGRRLRDAMAGMNHQGFLLPIHIWLFRSAGISTPVFDSQMAARYNQPTSSDEIANAEVVSADLGIQGEVNAAAQ